MLTKHGLFNKRVTSSKDFASQPAGHTSEQVSYVTPGHLAAINSAVIVQPNAPRPVHVPPLRSDSENHVSHANNRLVIGSGLKIKCGEIEECDHLMVEGCVDALLNCNTISVAVDGKFLGKAEVERADIAGIFEGELIVKGLLIVRSSAKVVGKISYGQLKIEEGGELSGDVSNSHQINRKTVVSSIAKLRHIYG